MAKREWPAELAWPEAPDKWRAFFLVLVPPGQGNKAQRARLSDLTEEELEWFVATLEVEKKRRPIRG